MQPLPSTGSARCALLCLLLTTIFAALRPALTAQQRSANPAPDVLIFTNGDQLTGKLERAVGGVVLFKSDMAGEISIAFSKVKELRSGSRFAVIPQHEPIRGLAAVVGTVQLQTSEVIVNTVKGNVERVSTGEVAFIIDGASYDRAVLHRTLPWEGWTGVVTGGLTLVRATQTGTTATGALSLLRTVPVVPYLPSRNRTALNITESYGSLSTPVIPQTTPASPNAVVLTSIFHADTERDEYVNRRLYALADASFDHNFAQGLQLQQLYGGGLGWTPLKNAQEQLDLKAEVHYEKQEFQVTASNLNLIGSTFSEAYRRSLPRKVLFTETANYLPAWNQSRAYSANVTGTLALPVFKRLSLALTTTDNYLNNPSPGYRKNSLQFVTGVTYNLP